MVTSRVGIEFEIDTYRVKSEIHNQQGPTV